MQHVESAGSYFTGDIALGSLNQLASMSSLVFARPGLQPITSAGTVDSQGSPGLARRPGRTAFDVDGSGITVGVLSDSFDAVPYPGNVDGVVRDIATGDLPANTQVLDDLPFGTDEGRGMAQPIHDVAPGAAIQFATAGRGPIAFANSIQQLAAAGSDVIVDDIAYLTQPFFQDDVISQSVDSVVAQGVPYFSAAGNAADASYESAFVDSGQTGSGGRKFHDFDPGPGVSTLQRLTIPQFGSVQISFQWDQPFRSVGLIGSASDLDISLLAADGTVVASEFTNNVGGDALEFLTFVNLTSNTTYNLRIELVSGPAPGLMKYINFGDGSTIDTFATHSSTNFGHSNSAGAMGVAASVYLATPAFGTDPPLLNDFSAKGGTPILFDTLGNRLAAPVDRQSPQVTGVDGANTTFFGSDISQDADSFPNFFGTSAAAPHVAAVAALMMQAAGGPDSLSPQSIYSTLEETAHDILCGSISAIRSHLFRFQSTTAPASTFIAASDWSTRWLPFNWS